MVLLTETGHLMLVKVKSFRDALAWQAREQLAEEVVHAKAAPIEHAAQRVVTLAMVDEVVTRGECRADLPAAPGGGPEVILRDRLPDADADVSRSAHSLRRRPPTQAPALALAGWAAACRTAPPGPTPGRRARAAAGA